MPPFCLSRTLNLMLLISYIYKYKLKAHESART